MAKHLALLLVFISLPSFGVSIISDLDDTIKVTNVSNKPRALYNALFSKKAFDGVPSVIKEILDEQSELYIVSASPNIFSKNIFGFLTVHKLNYEAVYMRKLSQLGQKKKYKLATIRKILNENPDDFIFIGDNVELDDEVYTQIKDEFPTRVKAIYIHQVSAGKPTLNTPFYTAYDIGLNEAKAGRFNYLELGKVAALMLKPGYMKNIFPSFKFCPTELNAFEQDVPLLLRSLSQRVFNRVVNHCKNLSLN